MAYRDDGDALLARADALERENQRLREQLEARDDESVRRRTATAEDQLARVRSQLEATRRPSLLERARARLDATRRALQPGPVEAGYAAAAVVAWRPWAAGVAMVMVIAAISRTPTAALIAASYLVVAPTLAALFALVPWALGHRRRSIAAGAAALGVGTAAYVAVGWVLLGRGYVLPWASGVPLAVIGGIVTAAVVLRVLGVIEDVPWWPLVLITVIGSILSPLLCVWGILAIGVITSSTARLPDLERSRS